MKVTITQISNKAVELLMSHRCTNISKSRKERHKCRYTKETVYTEDGGNVVQRTQTATAAQPIGIKPSTAMQIVSVMNDQLWTTHVRVRTSMQATHAFQVTIPGDTHLQDNLKSCFRATHAQ